MPFNKNRSGFEAKESDSANSDTVRILVLTFSLGELQYESELY